MPHIHLLVILTKEAQINTPKDVDEYICARVPYLPEMHDNSVEAKQQRRLCHLVKTTMVHSCSEDCGGTITGRCRKYFPKLFSNETIISRKCQTIFKMKNKCKNFSRSIYAICAHTRKCRG